MSESEEEYPETGHEDEEDEDEEEGEEGDGTAESQSDPEAEPEFKSPPVGDVSGGKLTSKESLANLISASEPIKVHAKSGHPKTADMVRFALVTMKERNGSSMQAIKKYISANYLVDATKIAPFLKKYVKAAVESGVLIQTKGKGATGSFKLNAVAAKKSKVGVKKQKSTEEGDVVDEPMKKSKKVVKEKMVKEKVVKEKKVKESDVKDKKTKAPAAKKKAPVKAQSSVEQSPSPKKATAGRKKAASAPVKEKATGAKAKTKTTAEPKKKKDKDAVAEPKVKDKKSPKKKAPAKKK